MIDARSWRFLEEARVEAYIEIYDQRWQEGWKRLEPATTARQFRTARDILGRFQKGTKGVLLADDVGLGKTTVAALCAFAFAGKQGTVRILAPNEMMERRWRQELEIHVDALGAFTDALDLGTARSNLGLSFSKLKPGQIAVTTHTKAVDLMCDLLIVDEAHRTRSEGSAFSNKLEKARGDIGRILVLTATPFSIDSRDLAMLLNRVGAGRDVLDATARFAKLLDQIWKGKAVGEPAVLAADLARLAKAAVAAMKPYVIRHSIADLSVREQCCFGEFKSSSIASVVGGPMLEAMLRADRALLLGRRADVWSGKRRNDPRYHVGSEKLAADLARLDELLVDASCTDATQAVLHATAAISCLKQVSVHPKVDSTSRQVKRIVDSEEKVLIFCDHHATAVELARELAGRLKRTKPSRSPDLATWQSAWTEIIGRVASSESATDQTLSRNFVQWLCSDGIRSQAGKRLGAAALEGIRHEGLVKALSARSKRVQDGIVSLSEHAIALFKQMTDVKSNSTRTQLWRGLSTMPGTSLVNICAVCDVPDGDEQGVFFANQPDTVMAVFNSPFGPDVLVTTDRLSEGVDLHRFCRHLIHHELDPSPVRTVQRNGRLRRVGSLASRTGRPIEVSYPALLGTRDERVVEIMQLRLQQFDLLLGGVGHDVNVDQSPMEQDQTKQILAQAQLKMGKFDLTSPKRK